VRVDLLRLVHIDNEFLKKTGRTVQALQGMRIQAARLIPTAATTPGGLGAVLFLTLLNIGFWLYERFKAWMAVNA
jgi:hypothetical protein